MLHTTVSNIDFKSMRKQNHLEKSIYKSHNTCPAKSHTQFKTWKKGRVSACVTKQNDTV